MFNVITEGEGFLQADQAIPSRSLEPVILEPRT